MAEKPIGQRSFEFTGILLIAVDTARTPRVPDGLGDGQWGISQLISMRASGRWRRRLQRSATQPVKKPSP